MPPWLKQPFRAASECGVAFSLGKIADEFRPLALRLQNHRDDFPYCTMPTARLRDVMRDGFYFLDRIRRGDRHARALEQTQIHHVTSDVTDLLPVHPRLRQNVFRRHRFADALLAEEINVQFLRAPRSDGRGPR